MSTIKRFEDLLIWQKARFLYQQVRIISTTTKLKQDFPLKNQINRSSGSIMDNIAEGSERDGNKEFRQFLFISKGSTGELKSQLYRCFDSGYIDKKLFFDLYKECDQLTRMIASLIKKLKDSPITGIKYKS